MPKGSPELTNSRREEIISACAKLYETMNFKDITIKEIGSATSFTRTSIYNYFHTKEEIFLALLQREYELWIADIENMRYQNETMTAGQFADGLAGTLSRRDRLLKILSMNLYDLEEYCRLDNLVEFKKVYKRTLDCISSCLKKFFTAMTDSDIQAFLYAFFPFIFGIYPYTKVTDKQASAMDKAGLAYPKLSIYEITRPVVLKLLQGFE
ncbi:MAG TPA: TetR family transcriptional regulator [Candidatus Alectryocaccobium stercorigallinarum]|nr:TetR family transcriptional regulator [Candidatus Alectryocaccobium stercorigallinarum]